MTSRPDPTCYCGEPHRQSFEEALDTLAGMPALLGEAFDHLGSGRERASRIIGHLKNAELVASVRYRLLLAEDVPDLPPFDADRWARRFGYDSQDSASTLEVFRLLRADNVRLLKQVDAADREHEGWHPEHGSVTLEAMVIHAAARDAEHLEALRELSS